VLAMHSRLQSKVVALDAKVDTLMLPSIFSQLPGHEFWSPSGHEFWSGPVTQASGRLRFGGFDCSSLLPYFLISMACCWEVPERAEKPRNSILYAGKMERKLHVASFPEEGVNTMIQIRLQPEIEAQLAAEAKDRGMALDRYIEKIVEGRPIEHVDPRSVSEAIDRIRELRKGNRLGGLNIKDLIHEGHIY
jgi:hypothetical protein